MEKETKRLFFAFELPERAIRTLESLQHDLQRKLRGPVIKWKRPEAWHITTHYIGEVSESAMNNLADAMNLIPRDCVSFTPWSLDVFPNRERPRYLVLKLADPSASGFEMHKAHFPVLLRENIKVDTRPWQPHIALGKITTSKTSFNADLSKIHVPQETFTACRLTLFETILDHDVRYEPVEWYDLPRK